jgi:predicted nucleic acid-binding protein
LIAFDNSAIQRLWDFPPTPRLLAQAAGVREVLRRIESGEHRLLMTWPLWHEIEQTRAEDRRVAAKSALPDAAVFAGVDGSVRIMARALTNRGLSGLDALHVATAWIGGATLMFTTDNGMLAFATNHAGSIAGMLIVDPAQWHEVL